MDIPHDQEWQRALDDALTREREVSALLKGARALLVHGGFETAARGLFDACKEITGATAGYVALLSEDGTENEVLFLDAGGRECTVDPALPMPIRGLRAMAYRENRAVYDNEFADSSWMQFMPGGHVVLENVMFAPLIIDKKAVGLIGLANKPGGFTDRDAVLASTFGELASVALRERRAEEDRARITEELTKALARVKTLRGLLPICAHCKKIRDDKGYWQQVEVYIRDHSEAEFSHGICPECTRKLYPDLIRRAERPSITLRSKPGRPESNKNS
jgi:hypothetical protein